MLEMFLNTVDPSNLTELAFEFLWNEYENDDIASVIDIPAWEPIDFVLCTLARRIREKHSDRRLSVILSVVAPQPTDLKKVKMGTLFTEFRREGTIALQYFIDHLPPVSPTISIRRVRTHRVFAPGRISPRYAAVGSGKTPVIPRNGVQLSRITIEL